MEALLTALTMIAVAFITTFTMLGILLTWEIIFPSDVLLADIIRYFTKGNKNAWKSYAVFIGLGFDDTTNRFHSIVLCCWAFAVDCYSTLCSWATSKLYV